MARVSVGDRVYCASFLFSGWGTVEYIEGDIYPIGVVMDEPDEDGHYYKRFGYSEVFTR